LISHNWHILYKELVCQDLLLFGARSPVSFRLTRSISLVSGWWPSGWYAIQTALLVWLVCWSLVGLVLVWLVCWSLVGLVLVWLVCWSLDDVFYCVLKIAQKRPFCYFGDSNFIYPLIKKTSFLSDRRIFSKKKRKNVW
jgi:hypothetical protein